MIDEIRDEESARRLLRKNILICAGGALGVSLLPSMLAQIRNIIPESRQRVVLTTDAVRLVGANALACLTDGAVLSEWPPITSSSLPHIELTEWADIVIVMPATANLLAKAAYGIADDLVTTCLIATSTPIMFVPSMNERMWNNKIVQDNVARLRAFGHHVIEPDCGFQVASRRTGIGALPPLRDILLNMLKIFAGMVE